jgi:hypothetical protein
MAQKKDYKPLGDDEVIKIVDDNIARSVGYYDSQLSRERELCLKYYQAELPKPQHDGNSKYVSMDVYDSVQSMQAALLESMAAGQRIVSFSPQSQEDVVMADIASEYCNYVAFRQNDFYSVASSVIHDGLMARAGICKVYWEDTVEYELEEFKDITEDELDMLLAADEEIELEDSETNAIGLVSGTISKPVNKSQVRIEAIPPESFIIEPQARSLDTVSFLAHRERKTITELREMGYSEKLIDKIGDDHDDINMETDPEVLARHEEIGSDRGFNAKGYQDQVRTVMVYECYIQLDPDASGKARLHKVCKAGNAILDIYEIDDLPFVAFVPLPIPHSFFGSNFAQKVIATQNARTVLTRSILDHAVITNNPRYMVVKGSLTSPREMVDNRLGGIVNVTRPDGVSPLPQATLNPFVFQTLNLLSEQNEDTTGVSRLSRGIEKDAISKQNSAAMVEQLATMSQQRQKIIARNFANQFVKPLWHKVYKLILQNETEEKIVQLAGNYVRVNPSTWDDKRDVIVELKLGYGEQERDAQKYLALHGMMSQDPVIAPMYGADKRYQMFKVIMEKNGILNVDDFLTPPDQMPPPQPDPMQQMQQQMAMKQLEIQERQTAVSEMKTQMDAEIAQLKLQLEQAKAQAAHALQSDSMDLKEAQLAHKQKIDTAELEILRTTEDKRGIVSPTG